MTTQLKPSFDELYSQISEDIYSSLGERKKPRFSVVSVVARALAAVSFSLYLYIDTLAKNMLPDSASKKILERWVAIWGVSRKAASYSEGLVDGTGEPGSVIPANTKLQDEDGQEFLTTSSATIGSNGTGQVLLRSAEKGSRYNLTKGKLLTLINPLPGITKPFTVYDNGISGGADIEDDNSLRSRLLSRIRNPPQGGAAQDYISWSQEIPGVTRSWVFPRYQGAGTVGVTFVLDGQSDIIPNENSSKFEEVKEYIERKAPITATTFLFAPEKLEISPSIRLIPDTPKVREQVSQELGDLFFREAEVGGAYQANGTILISKVREAISTAEGEQDHTLVSPTENITVNKGQIAVLGTIDWGDES